VLSFKDQAATGTQPVKGAPKEEVVSQETLQARLVRRGAQAAFDQLSDQFGDQLFGAVPKMWEAISRVLTRVYADTGVLCFPYENSY
jgi:TATA-binding protein-associated factor